MYFIDASTFAEFGAEDTLRLKWCGRAFSGVIRIHYREFIPYVKY